MSYYRPPDEGPGGAEDAHAPQTAVGHGIAPMPFDPTLAPTGRPAPPGPPPVGVGEGERDSTGDDEPVEEMWQVVATIEEPNRADQMATEIQEAGFETWVRAANDYEFSTGVTRVYEVLVREEHADAVDEIAAATAARWAEEAEQGLRGTADSNGCRRFVLVGGSLVIAVIAVLLVLSVI